MERFCFLQHCSRQLLTEVWSERYYSSSTRGSVVTSSVCRKFNFRGEPSRKRPCSYKYCIQELVYGPALFMLPTTLKWLQLKLKSVKTPCNQSQRTGTQANHESLV